MMDPDSVISSSPTHGYEKSLDGVALPSPVEINLVIAHEPGQLDSRVGNVEDVLVAESGEGEESKEEGEERSAEDVYKRQGGRSSATHDIKLATFRVTRRREDEMDYTLQLPQVL